MIASKKVVRDLLASRGRVAMMVGALTAAMIAFNAVIGAFGILSREMTASYVNTIPASATFDMPKGVDLNLLEAIRQRPEVGAAVRRHSLRARYRALDGDAFGRAHVFVVDDHKNMPVAQISRTRGMWPPPLGTVVLERSSLALMAKDVGDRFILRTPNGKARQVSISGIAHEPALAPAVTEQAIYVYVTGETLAWLGEPTVFSELRVLMSKNADDASAIESTSQALAAWLAQRGETVHSILIPPPRKHPHHRQFTAVMGMFSIFGVMTLVLTGILTAALLQTLMARQVREIGVMKTMGATRGQVQRLYGLMIGGLALLAFLLSLAPGVWGARAWAGGVARVLNFDLVSRGIPLWVFVLQACVGISLPLLAMLPTVRRGTRVSVTRALANHGTSTESFGRGLRATLLTRLWVRNRLVLFALRNSVRQRRRFLLTTGLLTTAGGLFITALSLANSWGVLLDGVFKKNHYDVEVVLQQLDVQLDGEQRRFASVAELSQVDSMEMWRSVPVTFPPPGRIEVQRTYPDGNHGSFSLIAPPNGSSMVDRELLAGRWLRPEDGKQIVLNQNVPGFGPGSVGSEINLSIGGRSTSFTIVGVIQEIAAVSAYISATTFASIAPAVATTRLRVKLKASPPGQRDLADLESQLLDRGARLQDVLPLGLLKNAVSGHFEVLVGALILLALLLAVVGVLGLSASMSASVIERTRELGVFRAMGARPSQVRLIVWLESTVVGVVSGMAAMASAIPLSLFVGGVIGQMSFGISLPLTLSRVAMGGWLFAAIGLSIIAAVIPARQATKLTVREALSHV